jgi:Xaa-Pro dipeptidase
MPHYAPGSHKLQPGPLTLDLGVVLDDYCSDMTRTVFYKDCPAKIGEVYNLVNLAKDEAFRAIRPGAATRDVDAVARRIITDAGYGDYFRHGLGHGVGLPFKGKPVLTWTSEDILAAGHVASDEPGIYLPGEGGVRIEDLFVVTETGAENLNELSCELVVVG